MSGFKTPTQDSIEHALAHHAQAGRIKGWRKAPKVAWSGAPKWLVDLNPGATYKDSATAMLVTFDEAKLFCAALASAEMATTKEADHAD